MTTTHPQLPAILSSLQSASTCSTAESQFESLLTTSLPNLGPSLLVLATSPSTLKPSRLLALILLRKLIKQKWRLASIPTRRAAQSPDTPPPPTIPPSDKLAIQTGLLSAIFTEPDAQISSNLALVIAAVAHCDFNNYPQLIPTILQVLTSPSHPLASKTRAAQLLRICVKDLASKPLSTDTANFFALSQHLLPPLSALLLASLSSSPPDLAYQLSKSLIHLAPKHPTHPRAQPLLAQATHILQLPCPDPASNALTNKLWRCLTSLPQQCLQHEPTAFSTTPALPSHTRTCLLLLLHVPAAPLPNVLVSFCFLTRLFSCKEYRSFSLLTPEQTSQLCTALVSRHLCLSAAQQASWALDPETTSELDESLTPDESPRAAAILLLTTLLADARARDILVSTVQSHLSQLPQASPAQAEAVLYSAGLCAFRLRFPELPQWLDQHLLPLTQHPMGFCQKRACWAVARFVADFADPASRLRAYNAVIATLERGSDFAARLAAAEALGDVVCDVDFDSTCFNSAKVASVVLVVLGRAHTPEAKVKLLDLLLTLADKFGPAFFRDKDLGEFCVAEMAPQLLLQTQQQQQQQQEDSILVKYSVLRLLRTIAGSLPLQPQSLRTLYAVCEWALHSQQGFDEDGLGLLIVLCKTSQSHNQSLHAVCVSALDKAPLRPEDASHLLQAAGLLGGLEDPTFCALAARWLAEGMLVHDACTVLHIFLLVAPTQILNQPLLGRRLDEAMRDSTNDALPCEDLADLLLVAARALLAGWHCANLSPLIQHWLQHAGVLGRAHEGAVFRRRLFCAACLSALVRLDDMGQALGLAGQVVSMCSELHDEWLASQPLEPWLFGGPSLRDAFLHSDVDFDLQRRLSLFEADVCLNTPVTRDFAAMLFAFGNKWGPEAAARLVSDAEQDYGPQCVRALTIES